MSTNDQSKEKKSSVTTTPPGNEHVADIDANEAEKVTGGTGTAEPDLADAINRE